MRRRRAEVRQLQPDLVYGDVVVSAFINKIMRDGKKNLAARIFYEACRIIQEKTGQEPLKVFKQAVENVKPRMEVRSRRVGGANYQVPMEVSPAGSSPWPSAGWSRRPTPAPSGGGGAHRPRAHGRRRGQGWGGQEEGGRGAHGRGQPRLRPLPVVSHGG